MTPQMEAGFTAENAEFAEKMRKPEGFLHPPSGFLCELCVLRGEIIFASIPE